MNKSEPVELAESARINLESTQRMNPGLSKHPIFQIALQQIKELCTKLEKEN